MASKMACRMGAMSGRGGVTPHIRTSSNRARVNKSSLSFTARTSAAARCNKKTTDGHLL